MTPLEEPPRRSRRTRAGGLDLRQRTRPAPVGRTCAGGPALAWDGGTFPLGATFSINPPTQPSHQHPPPFRLEKCLSNHSTLDHTVTMRDWYDPLLVSKHVVQGTVSSTHYIGVYGNTDLKDKNKTKTPPIGKRVTVNGKSK